MFICLVISYEFSTILRLHPQFGRQFATARSNNLYYCGFSTHLGTLIPFSDSGTLMYIERWVAFLTLEIQSIILQRQMQTDIFETCQYLDLTFVVGLLLYILFYILQFCWHNVIYVVPTVIVGMCLTNHTTELLIY